jgi:hypothetical protein
MVKFAPTFFLISIGRNQCFNLRLEVFNKLMWSQFTNPLSLQWPTPTHGPPQVNWGEAYFPESLFSPLWQF